MACHVRHRLENTPEPKELFAAARARCEKDDARTVPIHFSCILAAETPASLTVSDGDGHTVTVSGPTPELAQNKALTAAEVSARLQKTGGAPPSAARTALHRVAGGLFLSAGR